MQDPVLSIVIPAYNVARYIGPAVRSALDQTFPSTEVIVVNDGSTDDTLAVVEELDRQRRDSRLRIITRPNGGLSAARNTGIGAARGSLIGLLDGDDLWHATKAARHVEVMQRDERIGITFSDSAYVTEDGRATGQLLMSGLRRPSLRQMIRRNHAGNGSAPVIRRACFDRAGVFDESLRSCEDYEMWARILYVTDYCIERIPEPLTLYRLRESSLSVSFEKFLENGDRAVAALRQRMPEIPDRVFLEGHAMHYRIASRKAISFGRRDLAALFLRKALAICPWLFAIDPRAVATALLILSAGRGQAMLGAVFGSAMRSRRRWSDQDGGTRQKDAMAVRHSPTSVSEDSRHSSRG